MASSVTSRRAWLLFALAVVLVVGGPLTLYWLSDPEKIDLDDTARRSAPGSFAHLTDGYTHYEIGGPRDGRTVVLVAGFSVPYYIWDPTFAALVKAGYRALRYDYYGRGYSDRPDIPYTQEMYVRQLSELLDAAGVNAPVDLTGVSMGASVITSFADKYPDRVRSLTYVDPAFRSPYAPPLGADIPPLWSFMTAIFDESNWAGEQLGDFQHPENFPDWPDKYRVQMRYRGFRRARLSEVVANAHEEQGQQTVRVGAHRRPVLIIWGTEDRSVPFEMSDAVMAEFPRAKLVPVDDAGHLPQIERPEVFNKALLEFLR
jgi:pimeloyl-ACP methyl ester carboxylesterase